MKATKLVILSLFMGPSCMPDFNSPNEPHITRMHILEYNKFSWDLHEDPSLLIQAAYKPKLKDLKERVLLLSSPQHEIIKNIAKESSVAVSIKIFDGQALLRLTPKKSQLVAGNYYGLYWREDINQVWELKHVFYIKYPKPVLLKHDVEEKVAKNRRIFSFKFDQAINIMSDQAIFFKSQSGRVPKISSFTISTDQKTLVINREKEVEFTEQETYSIVFDNIVNLDNQKIILEPIDFVAGERQENLKIIKPPALDISSDSAEIRWYINNNFNAELYFGEDLSGVYNIKNHGGLDTQTGFLGTNFLTGLKPKTAYYYILRAEDYQGQIIVLSGVFKTRAQASLRFSEILINPLKKPEHKAEFIELFYAGLEPKKFNDLKLIFYDNDQKAQTCVLASLEDILYVRPKEYIIIVGHDFDELGAQVPKNTHIIRLPKKSLCGGLSNQKSSFLKLVDEIGMIDHYGAHLWHAPKGQSVIRRDVQGLDEFDNYCYSGLAGGPTPGGPN